MTQKLWPNLKLCYLTNLYNETAYVSLSINYEQKCKIKTKKRNLKAKQKQTKAVKSEVNLKHE